MQPVRLLMRQRIRMALGRALAVFSSGVALVLVADSVRSPPETSGGAVARALLIMVAVLSPIVFAIVMLLRSEKKDRR